MNPYRDMSLKECQHESVPEPTFDKTIADSEELDSYEVKRRWPRTCEMCKQCGKTVIKYESWAHFVYGDW